MNQQTYELVFTVILYTLQEMSGYKEPYVFEVSLFEAESNRQLQEFQRL